jgi:hypothetical protein
MKFISESGERESNKHLIEFGSNLIDKSKGVLVSLMHSFTLSLLENQSIMISQKDKESKELRTYFNFYAIS